MINKKMYAATATPQLSRICAQYSWYLRRSLQAKASRKRWAMQHDVRKYSRAKKEKGPALLRGGGLAYEDLLWGLRCFFPSYNGATTGTGTGTSGVCLQSLVSDLRLTVVL